MEDLYRIGIKFFADESGQVRQDELIPVFHRWIQERLLPDVLIDVTDYSHVHAGPGTLLVAHEGNYGYDETGNRRGLIYYSKHRTGGDLTDRLVTICRKALLACQLIEQSVEMKNRIRFECRELMIFSNDRLAAPNSRESFEIFLPPLRELLFRLFSGAEYEIDREPNPKERLTVHVKTSSSTPVDQLLVRLGSG